jgi:hypothetical protein
MLERFFAGYRAGSKKTMPKKAATARNSTQRTKAKTQKSFEVVRQDAESQELVEDEQLVEVTPIDAPTPVAEVRPTKSARRAATRASVATQEVETETEVTEPETEINVEPAPVAPTLSAKGSASARMAARRGQKLQQRTPATLVTSEHYAYVTRDLMIIAVLATIMFIAIIVLYFTIGRGA